MERHTTVEELAALWLRERELRSELTGRSVSVERARLGSLIALYGESSPDELDRRAVLDWQSTIGHLAPATRRATVGAVGRFLRWLYAENRTGADLSAHLIKVREPRRAPRALNPSDVATVIEACPSERGRAIIVLMVELGLRCVEVSRLDLDDYNASSATIFVRGKSGNERVLPLTRRAEEQLCRYLSERGTASGPLFLAVGSKRSPDGRISAKWISKRTGRLMRDAGVHKPGDRRTAHALRHTAASDVLDRCHDIRAVQQMLGHQSLATTEVYLRRADLGRLRQAMEGRQYCGSAS